MVEFTVPVRHQSHDHVLTPKSSDTPYTCNGCLETGWGLRFRCEECNYDLHKDCAYSGDPITHHFYEKRNFEFRKRRYTDTYCTACGKKALGFLYDGGEYKLHPCCANLKRSLPLVEVGELVLEESVHTTKCGKCRKRNIFGKEKGWSYRSACKKYHIHVACLKDMVKDLAVQRWEEKNYYGNVEIMPVPGLTNYS